MRTLTYLQPEDASTWDNFVRLHPNGSIYHLSGWTKAIEACFPHIKSKILTIIDDNTTKIVAGLPIYISRNLFGKIKLVSIPFALQGDALTLLEGEAKLLYEAMFEIYRQENAFEVEIKNIVRQPYLEKIKFSLSNTYIHHYLPLDREPELLRASFHKNGVQIPIRKALSNKIEIRKGRELSDLIYFYNIFYESRKRTGLPQIPILFFTSLLNSFAPTNLLEILIATFDNVAIGASLLLKFKDTVIIEYGCDLLEYRKLCTNHFLDWSAINLAYEEGFKFLSFGRTSDKNRGLMTYKNRWGTRLERLYMYHYPKEENVSSSSREESCFHQTIRTVLRKCPDSLYGNLSRIIYKQIQ